MKGSMLTTEFPSTSRCIYDLLISKFKPPMNTINVLLVGEAFMAYTERPPMRQLVKSCSLRFFFSQWTERIIANHVNFGFSFSFFPVQLYWGFLCVHIPEFDIFVASFFFFNRGWMVLDNLSFLFFYNESVVKCHKLSHWRPLCIAMKASPTNNTIIVLLAGEALMA